MINSLKELEKDFFKIKTGFMCELIQGYQNIIGEIRQRVGIITLNRPEVRNALSVGLLSELLSILQEMEKAAEVQVIVIRGAGNSFCSGHDFSGARRGPLWPAHRSHGSNRPFSL